MNDLVSGTQLGLFFLELETTLKFRFVFEKERDMDSPGF